MGKKKVRITSGIFWTLMGKNPKIGRRRRLSKLNVFFFHNSVGDHTYWYVLLMYHPYHRCIQQYYQEKCKSINVYRRAIYRRARRGERLEKKKKKFFPLPPLPLREAIYIYIYTHYVCFSSFLFLGDLHDSLDTIWQPLRKSDNLFGSLVIP